MIACGTWSCAAWLDPSGNKLRSSCRLMQRYAKQQAVEVANLQRLFGDTECFDSNIRALLELRLTQVRAGTDPQLYADVEHAIRDLQPEPRHAVVSARGITERALHVIWEAENPGMALLDEWKEAGVQLDDDGSFPTSGGRQCAILRRITGTQDQRPVARFVTKRTYLLVDHLQSIGDWGQHRNQEEVPLQVAASFCLSAIALCESLALDLAATG